MANEKLYIFLHFIFYKHLRDIENEGFLEVHVEGFHTLKLNTPSRKFTNALELIINFD